MGSSVMLISYQNCTFILLVLNITDTLSLIEYYLFLVSFLKEPLVTMRIQKLELCISTGNRSLNFKCVSSL